MRKDDDLMRRVLIVCAVLLVAFFFVAPIAPARAADDSQFFPQTNQTVSGKFLAYWRANGGLPVFGYPITAATNAVDPETGKTFLTQWFERRRFELHPENAETQYEVLGGLIGKDLRREAIAVDPDFQPAQPLIDLSRPAVQQRFFAETGHNVRGDFLAYWNANGGLDRFGYPIGEERLEVDPETGKVFVMQWFERARFESHPENAGTQYEVLLGLLGKEIIQPKPGAAYQWKTGNATQMYRPGNLAVDNDGAVYVVTDRGANIVKFGKDGTLLRRWKVYGGSEIAEAGSNDYVSATDVAADGAGNVYVPIGCSLDKYDNVGKLLKTWSFCVAGWNPKDGGRASAVAAANAGEVYVSGLFARDPANPKLLTQHLFHIDQSGTIVGDLNIPFVESLAVDGQGNIYSFSPGKSPTTVTKYTGSDGHKVADFKVTLSDTDYTRLIDLAVDGAGNMYIADWRGQVRAFDTTGKYLGTVNTASQNDFTPGGLAVDNVGNPYLTNPDPKNTGVVVFNRATQRTTVFTMPGGNRISREANGIALDAQGFIYVADTGNCRVLKFDGRGQRIAEWGKCAADNNQPFTEPRGIAVDKAGFVYVTDAYRQHIVKLDNTGKVVQIIGKGGQKEGQFYSPHGIGLDAQGNIYVADTLNYRVQKLDNKGNYIGSFILFDPGFYGSKAAPLDIAVDATRNLVYVTKGGDPANLQVFDTQGRPVTDGGLQIGPDNFCFGFGLGLDPQGNVYQPCNRIVKTDNTFKLLSTFSSVGFADGQYIGVTGIAVDAAGNVYLLDSTTGRVVKFIQR